MTDYPTSYMGTTYDNFLNKPKDFSEAVKLISEIKNIPIEEALTEFSQMTTINGMDEALNMVSDMQKNILEIKGFRPYPTTDGRYRGYVYFEKDGKRKRKPIYGKTVAEACDKALAYYSNPVQPDNVQNMTLEKLFPRYMKSRYEDCVSESTIARNQTDWKRYLEGDELTKKKLSEITYVEFVSWFKRKLKTGLMNRKTGEYEPYTTKQAKNLRSLLSSLFQYAVDYGYAKENLSYKMGRFFYSKFCEDKYKTDSEQVYQDDEPTKIMDLAYKRFNETHNFAYMAVILNFMLDLRVGELVALKFSDLADRPGQIHIQRQELPNYIFDPNKQRMIRQGSKEVNHTKTWVDRFVNLSEAAENVINIIREAQKELGIESEYLFVNSHGERIHTDAVAKVLRTELNPTIGTSQKSCHNIRKTVTSQLREELGVSVAARVAGHKNESTTDQHYSFSTQSNQRFANEYGSVVDKKVPDYLKGR